MSKVAFATRCRLEGATFNSGEGPQSIDRVNTGFSGPDTKLTPVTIAATSTRRSESWRVFC